MTHAHGQGQWRPEADGPGPVSRREPLFAPEVPEHDRELLLRERELLVAASRPRPLRPDRIASRYRPLVGAHPGITAGFFGLGLATAVMFGRLDSAGQAHAAGWIALGGMTGAFCAAMYGLTQILFSPGFGRAPTASRRAARLAFALHSRYLLPDDDLDERGGQLLARARTAAARIAWCSHALALPDAHAVLPSMLWDLGVSLAELAERAGRLTAALDAGGWRVKALTLPYRSAIERRYGELTVRVTKLEKLADGIGLLAEQQRAMQAAAQLDQDFALDLAADRAVRDPAALAQIADLAAQATAAGEQMARDYLDALAALRATQDGAAADATR